MSAAGQAVAGTDTGTAPPLRERRCVPCTPGTQALRGAALEATRAQVGSAWTVTEGHHLTAQFDFPDFRSALAFVNRVGAIAEAEGHHPDIFLAWGRVRLEVFTHVAGGLTDNDFILAAKIEQVL